MTPLTSEENHRCFRLEIERLRAQVLRAMAGPVGSKTCEEADEARHAIEVAEAQLTGPSSVRFLRERFRLSTFEMDVLLLCAALEIEPDLGARLGQARGESRPARATWGLAFSTLQGAHWSALPPNAPLRAWRLVEVGPADTLQAAPLRIDERILHFLAGVPAFDERLQGLLEPAPAPTELPPSHVDLALRVARLWDSREQSLPQIVQFCGPDRDSRSNLGTGVFAACGRTGWLLRAGDLMTSGAEIASLARIWNRETLLGDAGLLVIVEDSDPADIQRALVAFLERARGNVMVSAREPVPLPGRPSTRIDVQRPARAEQKLLWASCLGDLAEPLQRAVDVVSTQFDLPATVIRTVASTMRADVDSLAPGAPRRLWDLCRVQARPRLEDLAQRIEACAALEDLVLPPQQRQVLTEIAAHVRNRGQVLDSWGFADKGTRGLGLTVLFAGASGTGKTMAAEALARDLRLDLYRIDLSQVVSKYIGETEKNLRRVFDAAEGGGAVLLFDEADALFGKRSEVKDSHDRYANMEVGYLLQRMEAYSGLAILTTNLRTSLDKAFLRRLRFAVEFPFPDVPSREEIWRRVFPAAAPLDRVDFERLARVSFAGGNIRNIAVVAAMLAADAGVAIGMRHLRRAVELECAKVERVVPESEMAGWV